MTQIIHRCLTMRRLYIKIMCEIWLSEADCWILTSRQLPTFLEGLTVRQTHQSTRICMSIKQGSLGHVALIRGTPPTPQEDGVRRFNQWVAKWIVPLISIALNRGFPLYVRSSSAHISYMNSDLPHFLITAHSTATITLRYSIRFSAQPDNYPPQNYIKPAKLRLTIEAELCFLSRGIASLQTLP